jgi:hypothetical protein
MPVDFRYHLASIMAVLCALLIGILVGIGLVGNPELEQQVAQFRTRLAEQRLRLQEMDQMLRSEQAFAKEALPRLIAGRLQGRSVALVLNHDFERQELDEELTTLLRSAGANVLSSTMILPDFIRLKNRTALPIIQEMGFEAPFKGDLRSFLAGKMAVHIAQGKQQLPWRLKTEGLVKLTGNYEVPAGFVLIVAGAETGDVASPLFIDLPMIRSLQEAGIPVIGCEGSKTAVSHVGYYQKLGISTVDNVDTTSGKLALVLTLVGAQGHWGEKAGARSRMPPLEILDRQRPQPTSPVVPVP